MLMGTVCLNFYEPLSKCSPSGLNELQIHLTNAEKETNTFRKARIIYKRPENVSSILRIIPFYAEKTSFSTNGNFLLWFTMPAFLSLLYCFKEAARQPKGPQAKISEARLKFAGMNGSLVLCFIF